MLVGGQSGLVIAIGTTCVGGVVGFGAFFIVVVNVVVVFASWGYFVNKCKTPLLWNSFD